MDTAPMTIEAVSIFSQRVKISRGRKRPGNPLKLSEQKSKISNRGKRGPKSQAKISEGPDQATN